MWENRQAEGLGGVTASSWTAQSSSRLDHDEGLGRQGREGRGQRRHPDFRVVSPVWPIYTRHSEHVVRRSGPHLTRLPYGHTPRPTPLL